MIDDKKAHGLLTRIFGQPFGTDENPWNAAQITFLAVTVITGFYSLESLDVWGIALCWVNGLVFGGIVAVVGGAWRRVARSVRGSE